MLTAVVIGSAGSNDVEATVQVDAAAGVAQLRVTGFAKPASGETVTLVDVGSPAITFPEPGLTPIEKSIPFPLRTVGVAG